MSGPSLSQRFQMKFVELPSAVQAAVTTVVVYIVSVVLANLIVLIPLFAPLAVFIPQIAAGVAMIVLEALQNLLPSAYPQISILAVQLVLALLAAVGIGQTLMAMGVGLGLLGL